MLDYETSFILKTIDSFIKWLKKLKSWQLVLIFVILFCIASYVSANVSESASNLMWLFMILIFLIGFILLAKYRESENYYLRKIEQQRAKYVIVQHDHQDFMNNIEDLDYDYDGTFFIENKKMKLTFREFVNLQTEKVLPLYNRFYDLRSTIEPKLTNKNVRVEIKCNGLTIGVSDEIKSVRYDKSKHKSYEFKVTYNVQDDRYNVTCYSYHNKRDIKKLRDNFMRESDVFDFVLNGINACIDNKYS